MTYGVAAIHDSSAQDYKDKNETNSAGPYAMFPVCGNPDSDYCTQILVSPQWEFINESVYGREPTGHVLILQPLGEYKKKNEAADLFRESRPKYLLE